MPTILRRVDRIGIICGNGTIKGVMLGRCWIWASVTVLGVVHMLLSRFMNLLWLSNWLQPD
jgi:hypothetical protein